MLLVRFEFPTATVWAPPGGGIEPGESPHDAIRRELAEEVGLADPAIGVELWHRTHLIPFLDGSHDGQHDRYFWVPVPARFEPSPALSVAELRAEHLHGLRWWRPCELLAATHTVFAPRSLPHLVTDLLTHGPPPTPVDVGV